MKGADVMQHLQSQISRATVQIQPINLYKGKNKNTFLLFLEFVKFRDVTTDVFVFECSKLIEAYIKEPFYFLLNSLLNSKL